MTARVQLSWLDERKTLTGTVTVEAEGIEIDEVLDALLAGLAATSDRVYTIEAAEITELVSRKPTPRADIRTRVTARPAIKRKLQDPSGPVTPVDETPRVTPRG